MIDPADRHTKPLPLDEQPAKPRRGRPATGQALSNAERQRLYRERQKAQRNEKSDKHPVPYEEVVAIAQELAERCKAAEAKLQMEISRGEKTRKRIKELEAQLAQRNEKPSRLNEGMQKIIRDVHEVADAIEGSTWRIQRKARANGKWATLKGSYWNEAQAEDALADLPNKKGSWWRIVEVKSKVED